jgi:hypothetical protein
MNRLEISKWLFLSVAKHFTENISGITINVEGVERDLDNQKDWIEVRIDGPDISEPSQNVFIVDCRINLLVATNIDPNNLVGHFVNVGKAINAFTDFGVYRYSDDGTLVGVMALKPLQDTNDRVKVSNMGQIDPNINMSQTTVEGHFKMSLS